jgi:hypothetical protein
MLLGASVGALWPRHAIAGSQQNQHTPRTLETVTLEISGMT